MKPLGGTVEEYVSGCIQLATLLEVSAHPKPGNVHRTADFDDTKYEHFLASAVAIGKALRDASARGVQVSFGEISFEQVGIGRIVLDAVSAMMSWQHGGNTLLGSILLLTPISVAAGYVWSRPSPSAEKLRNVLFKVTHSSTAQDAVLVYDAIRASRAGGLGSVERFDIKDDASRAEIAKSGISLLEIFSLSSPYDSISSEWVSDFKITFELGLPFFLKETREGSSCNDATVHVFLKILSTVPDTLIARKAGMNVAQEISRLAEEALSAGGLRSDAGTEKLEQLDRRLRSGGRRLNPGTTADLTASSLAVAILDGYRP
jgi:triphosphoribosyl-dephospho-CoA synthase